jgi:hypothetical protein
MKPKVFTIILNWNGLSDTLKCLKSIEKSNYSRREIVVVDNGSSENPTEVILKEYPKVHVLRNSKNEGFSKGNNIGIRYALECGAEYVWLLNNDTEVEVDTLLRIIDVAESSSEIGLVSPNVHYFDEKTKVQFAGSYIDIPTFEIHYPENKESAGDVFQTGANVILWGTALLIKKAVIEKIGLLEEKFFAYWEDTEYSLRSLKSGYRNVVCSTTRVYHKRQLTLGGEEPKKSESYYYYVERNYLLLRRHEFQGVLGKIRFYLMALTVGSAHTSRCPHEYVDVALMGVWHGLKGISGPFKTEPRMPRVLSNILIKSSKIHPVFFANLLTFNFKTAYNGFLRWYKRSS